MPTSNKRQVEELKERVSRLVGEVRDSDFNVIQFVVTGDMEESCNVTASRHGRYKYFVGRQWKEIDAIMLANGHVKVNEHYWTHTQTPEQLAQRDKDVPPLTPAEQESDEDLPSELTHML